MLKTVKGYFLTAGILMLMACLVGPAFAGAKSASDADQLMKELDKLEANLKAMADHKAEARQEEQNQLAEKKGELKEKLKHIAKLSQNENIDEQQLVDLLTEVNVLREEIKLLHAPGEAAPSEQLVSSGEQDLVLAFNGPMQAGGGIASPMDARSELDDRGVTFEVVYTGEVSSNVSGGISQNSEYLENGDIVLSIDAEKLMNWKGASFSFYALADAGGSPTENVGDLQGVSNIDSDDTWKLYEAWYQQNLFDEKLSLLVGLYDLNSEFDAIETAGLFLNSSFGIGPDYSQSGENGPSIFPTTSLAFRVRVQPIDAFYVQSAIFDGVPGDPDDPTGTHLSLGGGDGALLAFETGLVNGADEESDAAYSKYALGAWLYTAKFDDISDVDVEGDPIRRSGNSGFYILGEQTVFREDDQSQGLALFARMGFANTKVNQIGSYFGGGLVYSGLIPGRNEDQFGLAVAAATNGGRFRQAQDDAGTPVEGTEVTFELSYASQILPHLAIHPDIQYVINPGTDPSLKNALLFGARFELSF